MTVVWLWNQAKGAGTSGFYARTYVKELKCDWSPRILLVGKDFSSSISKAEMWHTRVFRCDISKNLVQDYIKDIFLGRGLQKRLKRMKD